LTARRIQTAIVANRQTAWLGSCVRRLHFVALRPSSLRELAAGIFISASADHSKNFSDFDFPQELYFEWFAAISENYFDENENFAIFHVHLPRAISI
jgi:hypothetical protein